MFLKYTAAAALLAISNVLPAMAGDITISDAYARVSSGMAKSGAIFMVIENGGDQDDRLVAARSDVAERTELHTHVQQANGVMQMVEVKEGFVVPANAAHALARGGDHVMLIGLTGPLAQGDIVKLTLQFDKAGEVSLDVPVDNDRAPEMGMGMKKHN